ncbi:Gfo/Idh/MocA family protein [Nonomuraea sp. 10N515B]|uniref:Gfo/Idh/MocA family protein n=1 Tax=Nonomuraea sp. 10N515B TaxID=3457422 RepID=UPI003FCDA0F9
MPLDKSETPAFGLGVLGTAAIAGKRVLPAVAAVPGIEIAAIASRFPDRAEVMAKEYGGRPVEGYARLLEQPDVDIVYIPLPSALHAEWIERALLAGKHVLAEKPMTTSPHDTERLVRLAAERGLVLRENYMFLQHSQHAYVRRLLDGGAIGELRAFSAIFAIPPRPPDDIRYRAELGGGALLDVAGYPIRAAQLFLGGELEVAGASLRHSLALDVDVAGGALLTRPDGVHAHVSFGLEHLYASRYELLGSEGRIRVDHVFTPPPGHRPAVLVDRQDHQERTLLEPDDQFANTLSAFVFAVRTGARSLDDESIITQARLVDQVRRQAKVSRT